ncbi:MAG TPA: fructosamine kinase family protein [Chitinophagaceae bacterium]|nr:fructosamine kinase family protein [Chitinophagaceae bacterium]
MLSSDLVAFIQKQIGNTPLKISTVAGGSINQTFKIETGADIFFCKTYQDSNGYPDFLIKEVNGLEFLRKRNCIRIPEVIYHGVHGEVQILLLEWIEQGSKSKLFWKKFGEQLAALHMHHGEYFGLDENNHMGALPQQNNPHSDWCDFFRECRLKPQISLAEKNNLLDTKTTDQFEIIFNKLKGFFPLSKPSALHGDLWSGNFLCDENEDPVLIDPAVYYGDRNIDLAMSTLFGGFDSSFYQSYHDQFPLDRNHKEQWDICNLYPLLIHLNLFGKGYLSSIGSILKKYI